MPSSDASTHYLKAAAEEFSVDEAVLLAVYDTDLSQFSERLFRLVAALSYGPGISDFSNPDHRARAAALHLSFLRDRLAWTLRRQPTSDEQLSELRQVLADFAQPASEWHL
jgi:hypothetical protein